MMVVMEALLARLTATAASTPGKCVSYVKRGKGKEGHRRGGQGRRGEGSDQDEDDDPTFRPDAPFPWSAAAVALGCSGLYYKFSSIIAIGILVPIVNGVFFVCLAVYAFSKIKASPPARSPVEGGWSLRSRGDTSARGAKDGSSKKGRKGDTRRGSRSRPRAPRRNSYLFG